MNTFSLILKSLLLSLVLSFPAFAAGPVNINTADAAALSANLHGVGPAKAQAIVKYRKEHGDFASVDDLEKVKGIGPETVKDNRTILTVGGDDATHEGSHSQ